MAINLGQLYRSRTDKHVGGVAGGLAHFFDIDPVVVRVAFVVLAFFGGAGLLLYLGFWIFTPLEGDERVPFSMDSRSRTLALSIVISLSLIVLLGTTFGHLHAPWFVWVIAAGALLLLWRERQRRVPYVRVRRGWVEDEPASPAPPVGDGPIGADDTEVAADEPHPAPEPQSVRREPTASGPGADDTIATFTSPSSRRTTSVTFESYQLPQPKRRPGPVLFWFTLAVIALAEGVLGTVDVAGANIVGPAYAAVAVGITAVMLVVGSFWGRPGGLILIGLIASLALVASTSAHKAGWDGQADDIHVSPASTASLASSYSMRSGRLTLDLTGLSDVQSLAGRSIDLHGRIGRITVLLPNGAGAVVHAEVHGPGHVEVAQDEHGGFGTTVDSTIPAASGYPTVGITADLSVGEIDIERD